ncbi:hypothetical protein ACFSQD_02695 [Flavihumibacter stibioxidans]|uniref:Uncharacterized protein n=1 Tax=Flavihumibacter stibioxidans TaxID=1834163 RepID=A0ABR7MEQ3_9BACT|nr:hypothetical protein [Flavihumibacter stibioxidans]MBC6493058.1 hypothetical protein [Flavihumibacter stibioxidans]
MKNIGKSLMVIMLVLAASQQMQAQSGRPVAKSNLPSNRNPKQDKFIMDQKIQQLRAQARQNEERMQQAERQRAQTPNAQPASGPKQ